MTNLIVLVLVLAGLGLLNIVRYNTKQRKNNFPKVYYKEKLIGNYNGCSIPPFGIFIKNEHKRNTALFNHELVHWKQYQRDGLIKFLFNYSKYTITKGYDLNPYEIEARQNETPYCQTNYTDCVRKVIAKSVKNTNFRK